MLNSGKKILPLVLSEENFLNETKKPYPLPPTPFKLNGRSLLSKEMAFRHLITAK